MDTTQHNEIDEAAPPHEATREEVEAFAGRVGASLLGAATLASAVLGDRLGLYAVLAGSGPVTAGQLAETTGNGERLLAEWLAQQAAAGFLSYEAQGGTFALPAAHAAVLVDGKSPASMMGDIALAGGMFRDVDMLARAFGSGNGVDWADHDPLVHEATERGWGARYRAGLGDWLASLARLDGNLRSGGRVADVGCGRGYPSILLAQRYPATRITGFDLHSPSLAVARERAAAAGVSARVGFEVADSAGYPGTGYDLVAFFDAFHDLGDPLGAAVHARDALAEDGTLLLVEPFSAGGLQENLESNPAAAFGYAASTFFCTPSSLAQPVGLALGAMSGEKRLRELLTRAGFTAIHLVATTPFNLVLAAQRRHADS